MTKGECDHEWLPYFEFGKSKPVLEICGLCAAERTPPSEEMAHPLSRGQFVLMAIGAWMTDVTHRLEDNMADALGINPRTCRRFLTGEKSAPDRVYIEGAQRFNDLIKHMPDLLSGETLSARQQTALFALAYMSDPKERLEVQVAEALEIMPRTPRHWLSTGTTPASAIAEARTALIGRATEIMDLDAALRNLTPLRQSDQ